MKKWISLLAAFGLAAALTACGGSPNMKPDEEWNREEFVENDLGPGGEQAPAPAGEDDFVYESELGPAGGLPPEFIAPAEDDVSDESPVSEVPGELASAEFSNPLVEAAMPDDHTIDWGDAALEAAMRDITGIADGDIRLSDVWETMELDLSDRGVTDITALRELTNLMYLDLSDNRIADLRPLEALTALSVLDISDNPAADLAPVGALPYLTELYAEDCDIEDLAPLTGAAYLSWVDLSENRISDIAPLAQLTELVELDLSENPLSDLRPLASLAYLTTLDISDTAATDLTPLTGLTNLYALDVSDLALPASEIDALREALPFLEITAE